MRTLENCGVEDLPTFVTLHPEREVHVALRHAYLCP